MDIMIMDIMDIDIITRNAAGKKFKLKVGH